MFTLLSASFHFNYVYAVTRHLRKFFDGFHVRPTFVRIKREIRTEFVTALTAPARIVTRRMTAACDKEVELEDILDPALQPVEPIKPGKRGKPISSARIIARRATVADDRYVDNEQEQCDDNFGSPQLVKKIIGSTSKITNNVIGAVGTSASSV